MSEDEHNKSKGHAAPHGGGGGHGHGADAGHEEEHPEGAAEWIISFADNTALMMGFFVILLALNMGPKGGGASDGTGTGGSPSAAELDWALSIREGFNNPVRIDSTNPGEALLAHRLRERMSQAQAEDHGPRGNANKTQSIRPTDYHGIAAAIPFAARSTQLGEEARETLASVADHARGLRLMVEVRGHTSPAESQAFDDHGMSLSFSRAMVIARELENMGVEWQRMRIIASGDNERLRRSVYTGPGQETNQRVEVVLTNELMPGAVEDQPVPPADKPKTP
ncbi:MAG: OmpA family protein [Planctomycetes bacterium]|nr:OmpA family protein [Planctomycetota bacterium]